MNGVWTLTDQSPFGQLMGGHRTIGEFCPALAVQFFDRMKNIGVPAMVAAAIPKELRDKFYAGDCVILTWDKLDDKLVILTREGIEHEIANGKKHLSKPPDQE